MVSGTLVGSYTTRYEKTLQNFTGRFVRSDRDCLRPRLIGRAGRAALSLGRICVQAFMSSDVRDEANGRELLQAVQCAPTNSTVTVARRFVRRRGRT